MARKSLSSRGHLIRLFPALLVPGFVLLVRLAGNATEALAITEAIPLIWVLGYGVWRRRIEPVGAIAVVLLGIALLVTIGVGGSPLPLELHRALFPGAVGLACVISLAVHKPLLSVAKTRLAQARSEATANRRLELDAPHARRALTTLTAILGVTFLADAAAQIVLAFTVSAATFGVVARLATWVIVGTGLGVCALYLHWTVARHRRERVETPRPEGRPVPD